MCRFVFVWFLGLVGGLGLLLSGCGGSGGVVEDSEVSGAGGGLEVGMRAPGWGLVDLEGGALGSDDFVGRVVVLNFWATWCPPCVMEVPDFIEIQEEFGGEGMTFVGVSLDTARGEKSAVELVSEFVAKYGVNYPMAVGDERELAEVTVAYGGVSGIPTTFVIDREGVVRWKKVGMVSKEEMLGALRPWL